MKIGLTTNDFLNAIEKAQNTEGEKAAFRKWIMEYQDFIIEDYPTGLQIVAHDGTTILLLGITKANLIYNIGIAIY